MLKGSSFWLGFCFILLCFCLNRLCFLEQGFGLQAAGKSPHSLASMVSPGQGNGGSRLLDGELLRN